MANNDLGDLIKRDIAANRPAAGIAGRLFYDTTNSKMQRDNGATWDDVEPAGLPPSGSAGGDLSGTYPNPAVAQASAAFALLGDISPASLSVDQNDYNPTSLSSATVLRLTSSVAVNITGLQGGADGRIIVIYNIGSNAITLKNEDSLSSAANRFSSSGDVALAANDGVMLVYDSTGTRWKVIGKSPGGGGGVTRSGATTDGHLAVWNGSSADSIKDGGAVPVGGGGDFLGAQVFS